MLPGFIRCKLVDRANLHLAIHNTGWLLFDKLLRALLGLIIGAWLARYLGPYQFGELAYYIAFIALFQAIASLGMDGIVVRELAKDKQSAHIVLGSAFSLRMIAGVFCWLCAVFFAFTFGNLEYHGIWMVALVGGVLIFQPADTIDLWFQSQSQSRRTITAKLIAYLVSNAIKVFLILQGAPIIAFAMIIAIEASLCAIALYVAYRKFPCRYQWKCHFHESKAMLKESWPYMISGLSIIIYMRIDQIMIKNILDATALGLYAAIMPISGIWNVIPVAICTSIAPFLARKKIQGERQFDDALLKVFRVFLMLSVFISVLILLFSDFLVNLMYGASYQGASKILSVYIFTNIPIFLGVAQGLWLLNKGKPHFALIQTIAGAATSILGNLVLLPILGLMGAAITAVLAQFISAVFINFLLSRKLFLMQFGVRTRNV